MGIPAGNWKLEPARFSEMEEQFYCPARCKNAEDRHWSNTRRENLKIFFFFLNLCFRASSIYYINKPTWCNFV
jgi:hypothetical protein